MQLQKRLILNTFNVKSDFNFEAFKSSWSMIFWYFKQGHFWGILIFLPPIIDPWDKIRYTVIHKDAPSTTASYNPA